MEFGKLKRGLLSLFAGSPNLFSDSEEAEALYRIASGASPASHAVLAAALVDGDGNIYTPANLGGVTGVQAPAAIPLTYGATVSTNATLGNTFDLTLSGNAILSNPSGGADGQRVIWRIRQDATGSRVVTLGNKFRIPSSAATPLGWSTAASALDYLCAVYNSTNDKWDVVSFVPGY